MGIVQLEDMEGEATVIVFPKIFKAAEGFLYGEVDPETGALLSDAFVRITRQARALGPRRSDHRVEIMPLELTEENNQAQGL